MIQIIIRDLHRTNPQNTFYAEKNGVGQKGLFNILRCFSSYYKETEYVQGMGFIAACFLTYMDEESVFWLLYTLMEKYKLKALYEHGFPGLDEKYYIFLSLMKKYLEKIYYHLKTLEIYPSMYAMNWFLTLFFSNNKIPETAIRIFDMYLLDKDKILYRFSLALLKANEERILSTKEFDKLLYLFKEIEETNIDIALPYAINLKISSRQIEDVQIKYKESLIKSDEIIEFIKEQA